jgi:hypothetical protein
MALMPPQVDPTQPPKKLLGNSNKGTKAGQISWAGLV